MILSHLIKQKPYEKIEYFLHRHGFTFIPKLFIFAVLMAMPYGVYYLINSLYPQIFTDLKILSASVLFASIYYLGIYLFVYAQFVEFYLDSWVVTNDRIIDINQLGLFSQSVAELDLYHIQDVTVNVKGFFPTIFHYGNVVIKTASGNTNLIFKNVSQPNEIGQTLIQLAEADRKFHHQQ